MGSIALASKKRLLVVALPLTLLAGGGYLWTIRATEPQRARQRERPSGTVRPVIGLLELPRLFGLQDPDLCPGWSSTPGSTIDVYAQPSPKARVVTVLTERGQVERMEHAYEAESAVTYDQRHGWYLIGVLSLNDTGWIAPHAAGKFRSIEELIFNGLAHVTIEWNRELWDLPQKSGKPRIIRAVSEAPPEVVSGLVMTARLSPGPSPSDIRVVQAKRVGGELWFNVEVLDERCETDEPKTIDRGWIPAYARSGNLNVWFYSRGC